MCVFLAWMHVCSACVYACMCARVRAYVFVCCVMWCVIVSCDVAWHGIYIYIYACMCAVERLWACCMHTRMHALMHVCVHAVHACMYAWVRALNYIMWSGVASCDVRWCMYIGKWCLYVQGRMLAYKNIGMHAYMYSCVCVCGLMWCTYAYMCGVTRACTYACVSPCRYVCEWLVACTWRIYVHVIMNACMRCKFVFMWCMFVCARGFGAWLCASMARSVVCVRLARAGWCVYGCLCVCAFVGAYACIYIYVYVISCMYKFMCTQVCLYACIYIYIYIYT